MELIDLMGLRFGRLTVVARAGSNHENRALWTCRCDCGQVVVRSSRLLRQPGTSSCGCWLRERAKAWASSEEFAAHRLRGVVTHGQKRGSGPTPEYATWLGIKRRCTDKSCKDYPNWGGRGIFVSDKWIHSFETFFADMGPRPSPKHSIDRIDPNGPYSKANCRWATIQEQGDTKRSNIPVTIGELSFPSMAAACRHFGVILSVAHTRIKAGIPADIAVSKKERLKPRRTRESYWPRSKRTHP
jgi:hypothetical protein